MLYDVESLEGTRNNNKDLFLITRLLKGHFMILHWDKAYSFFNMLRKNSQTQNVVLQIFHPAC